MEARRLVVKHAFYIFSFSSAFAGILAVWFGLSLLPHLSFLQIDTKAVFALSAVGAGLAVIALIGVYGSIRRSYIPILLHGIFHSGMFCYSMTIMLFIWMKMKPFIRSRIHDIFIDKFTHDFLIVNSTMDVIQCSYQCCGKYSYLDYFSEPPQSCYSFNECTQISTLNTMGCVPMILFNLRNYVFLAKFGVVVIVFLEFLTVVSSISYANLLKNKKDIENDLLVAEVMY